MRRSLIPLGVLTTLLLALVPFAPGASSSGVGGRILALDLGTPEGPGSLQLAGFAPCASSTFGVTCYDLVPSSSFSTTSFTGYTAIFVGWTEGADPNAISALYARSADIELFVTQGGGLVAYSEHTAGQWTWIPGGSAVTYAHEHADDVVLTVAGASHPAYEGQTSASLSNWGNSRHNYFTSWPAYLVPLATDVTSTKVLTLAGSHGLGCVLITGQDPDWHAYWTAQPAALDMVGDSVDWASGCGVTPPIPAPGKVLALDLGTPEGPGALQKAGVQACTSSTTVLCYDLVSPAAFQTVPLAGYDVLFVGWTYTGYGNDAAAVSALTTRSADIAAWVTGGGALVALAEFDPTGVPSHWTWIPDGALPPIGYATEHADDVKLPAVPHPVYAGQTSASVSGWENARHNYFTSWPAYLSPAATDNSGSKAVSLAGTYGTGCVFITGQDPDWHSYYADTLHATLMMRNAMSWAAQC